MGSNKALHKTVGVGCDYTSWACDFYSFGKRTSACWFNSESNIGLDISVLSPVLKRCFKNTEDAYHVFEKELVENLDDLRANGGVFFSMVADPMREELLELTGRSFSLCNAMGVPATFVTDHLEWAKEYPGYAAMLGIRRGIVSFGTTLPAMLGQRVGASPRSVLVEGLKSLHTARFLTWLDLNPISDFGAALDVFTELAPHLTYIRVGLSSGLAESASWQTVASFVESLMAIAEEHGVHVLTNSSLGSIYYNAVCPPAYSLLDDWERPAFDKDQMVSVTGGDIQGVVQDAMDTVRKEAVKQRRKSKKHR